MTPPLSDAGLSGITRDSVLAICQDLGITTKEQAIPREMLYIADEVFFSGTAAEITPIRSVDRIVVGGGSRGPIAKRVQEEFFAVTSGRKPDRHGWLTTVSVPTTTAAR
jgi:branched-chain amino acid aminotransferase